MTIDPSDGFTDNWAYLRTELRWLDQVLMLAVARQRKETHEVERVAQSKADRATSAWWKGIITTEGKVVYDEHRQPQSGVKTNYQQQLEGKIQTSSRRGIMLALPALCDRLQLTLFEKNLVLMSLAPEVNRRYARLYRYLQGDDAPVKTDLPTLDLVLRLMCRNDHEWRSARHRLVSSSPLIQLNLLEFASQPVDSSLNSPLKLSMPVINYLLAEQPTQDALETLLQPSSSAKQPALLRRSTVTADWSDLILPESVQSALQYLVQQIQGQTEAEKFWGVQFPKELLLGTIALLMGEAGTGKTLAAEVIARSLQTSLSSIDLALVEPETYPQLLQEIADQAPSVLLVKSAQCWLGRSELISPVTLRQFFAQRRQVGGVTLLSVHQPAAVQVQWRQAVDQVVKFPMPQPTDRLLLWQRAFPPSVPLSLAIDWNLLATQVMASGGEIVKLAHAAVLRAAATGAEQVEMSHIAEVLAQQGKPLKYQAEPSSTRKTKPKRTSAKSARPSAPKTSRPETVPPSSESPTPEPQPEPEAIESSSEPPIERLTKKPRKPTSKRKAAS
ncbi:hypothetical protein C7B76_14295 [filamentous cyanobacterium CCP2]|nr:hypothetical protein C7B76_14295 [filamentous cyanobacterium CCP2]